MNAIRMMAALVLAATLTGCVSDSMRSAGYVDVGPKRYTGIVQRHFETFGTCAATLSLVESDLKVVAQPQPPSPPPPPQVIMYQPTPQATPLAYQLISAPQPTPPPQNTATSAVEIITATHVVNNNNASCVGWANNAFQGAVGDALLGGGMVGAAAVLRPARTFVNGGSSSATGGAATGGNATGGAGGAGGLGGGGGHGGSGFATATGGAGGAGGSSSSISSSGSSANSTAGVAP